MYNSAYDDAVNGRGPRVFGFANEEERKKYEKDYASALVGYEYGKAVGEGLGSGAGVFFLNFFYRMCYLMPALFVWYLVFDHKAWGLGGKIGKGELLAVLYQILFLVIPLCLVTFRLYRFCRGYEFAGYLFNKDQHKKITLLYGLGFYSMVGSCIFIVVILNAALGGLIFKPLSLPFYLAVIQYLFLIYVIVLLVREIRIYHWDNYKNFNWFKESKWFKKGFDHFIKKMTILI
jgi:hypothetical protein